MSIEQVNDLAALKAIDPGVPTANEVRFMKRRATPDDPGAGVFEWQPVLESPDDATVVLPNTHPSSSSGRWIRQVDVRGPVHAEWFGAKGDGVADDSQAIQNCLDTFGRVSLLPRTYCIESSLRLSTKDGVGYILEGAGTDKTTLKDKRAGGAGGAAAMAVIENKAGAPAPSGAIVQNLTIDCAYNESWSQLYASRQGISLQAPDVIVRSVKAINFGAGSSGAACRVISLEVDQADDRLGRIEDCVVSSPGNNQAISYPGDPPPIICLYVGAVAGGAGGWTGRGGCVCGNRCLELRYTGSSGIQRSPIRGLMFAGCYGTTFRGNEFLNLEGVCVYSETGIDKDVVIEGNRFLKVNVGVYLGDASTGANHSSTGAKISGNLITLGRAFEGSAIWQGLYGIWLNVLYPASALADCLAEGNCVQGECVDSIAPVGVYLYCGANPANSRFHVVGNTLELPNAVGSGGFNTPYENAVVFSPKSQYLPAQVQVHGNRNMAGTDVRLKLKEGSNVWWGPYSTRLARFQSPAFDGRVGLATEEFLGQGNSFALGWVAATTGFGSIQAQAGQAGHPGIVLLDTGSSSSVSSAMLKYGQNGVVLGTAMTHVVEFGAKRTVDATSAENYECRLGLMQSSGDTGVYFKVRYVGPSNDNLIIAVAANGATSSSITSSLQDKGASRVWRSYRMEIGPRVDLPSYLEVRFFVDGDYLGRVQNDATSTYIPSATVLCAPRVERLSGVTSKGMLVDYFQHQVAPT